jgi:hypothetical protein
MATVASWKMASSATTCISLAAALANDANTHSGHSGITQTALDNSTDKYPHCKFVLSVPETFAAAPSTGAYFDIWMTENDIDGTSDETPVPGATDIESLARRVGSIIIDNQDVAQLKPLVLHGVLAGVSSALFYVRNKTGQATTYSATPLTLKVQPFTYQSA